jgi:hypothetical protein
MSTEAKVVKVGPDLSTLSTLPGSSGEISIETSENDNTIFGSVFSSTLPGVRDYTFSGNAWFRQTPGFQANVKKSGDPTAVTGVALSQEDGQTYIVDDLSQTPWDWNQSVDIRDDGSLVDPADIESIDYMFGRVTFVDTYTVTGNIEADASYLPLTAIAAANNISVTQNAESVSNSSFNDVQSANGFNTYRSGLKDVSIEVSGFDRTSNTFFDDLKSVEQFVIDVDWEGTGQTLCRGVFTVQSTSQSGDVGENEEFDASFSLFVPENVLPFSWYFGPNTEATQGMQDIINAWINRTDLSFEYLPNGEGNKGFEGAVVVTDASIETSVDGIGELTLEGQGNGELTVINAP